jgi:hypothetical protein
MDRMFELEIKTPYSSPKLTIYGTIEEIKKKALAPFASNQSHVECDIRPLHIDRHEEP